VLGLVAARARRRRSAAALVALSVAGSVVVLGSLLGVGIVTEDLATRRALGDLRPTERLIGLHRYTQDGFLSADDDAIARAALEPVAPVTEDVLAVRMYQPPREPFRLLLIDGLADWVDLTEGRLPKPCTGKPGVTCEAVRVGLELPSGQGQVGTSVELEGVRFDVVGVAVASADLPLDAIRPDGLALFLDGLAGFEEPKAFVNTPRTGFWLAPLRPEALHSWTLADLDQRVDAVGREMGTLGRSFLLDTPQATLEAVHRRTEVAIGRLVFISSLIVGVLLAFAVFAAAIERSDVAMEDRRLRAAGAGPGTRLLFVAGEAFVPAIAGAVLGVAGAAGVIAWLATQQGAPVDVVLPLALLQPAAIALIGGLVALAMVAIVLGIHPAAGRLLQPRIVAAAVLPAAAILAWQQISAGPVAPAQLAADATSPTSAILPGALGLTVILGALVLLPPLLRGLARITRRAPIGIRLAAISVAREPLRPAAIMTLLAFSVGAVVFGQVYAATLQRGAVDQAAFATGMDIRIQSLAAEITFGQYVVPLLEQGELGADVEVLPMVRKPGETASHRLFTLVSIDALALGHLKGWRSEFSPMPPDALGAAIHLEGTWELITQDIPEGDRTVTIDVGYDGEPINLALVVEAADGSVDHLPLGELQPGRQSMTATLDLSAGKAWHIVGLLASNGGDAGGGGPKQGQRQEGDVTIRGLEGILDPATPIHLTVSGAGDQLIRPPVPTDDLVFPALVSRELADDVNAEGEIELLIGTGLPLRIHPIGTTTGMPSIVDQGSLVIVDLPPLLLAMNAHDPGTGLANQVLLGTPNDQRTAEVVAALAQDPFPSLVVASRPAIEAERSNDPFALGLVWALAIGAIAGLLLSFVGVLLAMASDLRDERGELWELEAQGTTPRSLTGLVVLRTIAMCVVGSVAGVAMGIALGWFVAVSVGVGADAGIPIPPLALVAPWGAVVAIPAALVLVIAIAVFTLARRHFTRMSLGMGVR
jgi:hypothetical protein